MTDPPAHDFTVTLAADHPRAAAWLAAYGALTLPVQSPFPQRCEIAGVGEALCYFLDWAALTEAQRARVEAYLAARYGVPLATVQADLAAQGTVPILAEGCSVTIYNPHRWL